MTPHLRTAHTTNLVPVILVGAPEGTQLHDGRLADLAPSLLALMGLSRPAAMTAGSLIVAACLSRPQRRARVQKLN